MNRARTRFFLFLFVSLIFQFTLAGATPGSGSSFRRVNSGTRANIRQIETDTKGNIYFLTDEIYLLQNDRWEKLDFPVDGKIYTFYPVSPEDIWFTVNLVSNVSALYHFHDGLTERIRPPFSNHISAICPAPDGRAFFASYAEIAQFDNGLFRKLPTAPVTYVIDKIIASDQKNFLALTNFGEWISFSDGSYKRLLGEERVQDFCISSEKEGYCATSTALFRINKQGVRAELDDPLFGRVVSMELLDDGSVLMTGLRGTIAVYSGGRIVQYPQICRENLSGLVKTKTGDIWICGENGVLLYSGSRVFPAFEEDRNGFSSEKLIYYGISTDDEYGAAIGDLDGDGFQDIYAVRIYEQNRLYINHYFTTRLFNINSGFDEEAFRRNATGAIRPELGSVQNELKLGVCMADLDNDHDQDLYLSYLNSVNKLLLNKGDGFFRNVSTQLHRACDNIGRSNAAAVADIDLDGDLDLFVTNEEGSNRLYENDGTAHFKDITSSSGLVTGRGGMCASFADVNGDGYPDLAVSFWNSNNRIYLNTQAGERRFFRDISDKTDLLSAGALKSNAVAFADVNNDGYSDLFIANRNASNKLYLNDGNGKFTDRSREFLPGEDLMTNGAVFADFDLDGFQDLYLTCVGENVLYRNISGWSFMDVTASYGAELSGYCTGCATGDIDNDGDPDLYVSNYINGDSKLFLNNVGQKRFVKFRLHGIRSNRDAIGAKVWLYEEQGNKLCGYREITGGGGYASCSSKEVIFGAETGKKYYARIKFPSSNDTLKVRKVYAGMVAEIDEIEGLAAMKIQTANALVSFFSDEETRPELVKFLLILAMLVAYNLRYRSRIARIRIIRLSASFLILVIFSVLNGFFLYQWPGFSFFISPIAVLVLMALLHFYIERTLLRKMAAKEKLELREKLSRDLHDDLASTLGSISIYADTLKTAQGNPFIEPQRLAGKIADLTQASLQSISDIIWMTAPHNDSLQSLVSKTTNYMVEILTDNQIGFSSDINIPETPMILGEKIRNDAFLILKEGLNNIIRHSGAGKVEFSAAVDKGQCRIILKDDGHGFDETDRPSSRVSGGNGLLNMRKRAQESGIQFHLATGKEKGTLLELQFKI